MDKKAFVDGVTVYLNVLNEIERMLSWEDITVPMGYPPGHISCAVTIFRLGLIDNYNKALAPFFFHKETLQIGDTHRLCMANFNH